jgi:putative transposase
MDMSGLIIAGKLLQFLDSFITLLNSLNVKVFSMVGELKTQIPHAKFIEMLTYKLERVGITVKVAEESYTSKSSAIDWDIIPTYQPNKKIKHIFSGRRVERAWYVSSSGLKIHADVNAGYNIGRKSNPEGFDCIKSILRDRGCLVVHPRRITPLFKRVHAESRVA